MSITTWPLEDRPREKLLTQGEQVLTDAELVAILLKTGVRGKTALDIARELLQEYGGLTKLLSQEIVIKKQGIGKAKLAILRAAFELGRRHRQIAISPGTILNSSQRTQQFLTQRLRKHTREVFACLFLDTHFRLISFEELFFGTINEANIYPREIVRRSLLHNAAKVILAHNHPSGNPAPSPADEAVTRQIREALTILDITVVDHIIIGNPDNFSFAENGL